MRSLKIGGGVVLILLGLLWIGQGLNLVPGSFMSGQSTWALIGVVVALVGTWLVWRAFRVRGAL